MIEISYYVFPLILMEVQYQSLNVTYQKVSQLDNCWNMCQILPDWLKLATADLNELVES